MMCPEDQLEDSSDFTVVSDTEDEPRYHRALPVG